MEGKRGGMWAQGWQCSGPPPIVDTLNHIKIRFNQVFHPVPFFSIDVVQPAHPPGRSEDGHGLANRLEGGAGTSLKEAANGVAYDSQLPIQDQSFR